MKRTFLDRLIGFFSPSAEASRIQSRVFGEMNLRAYDAAKNFQTSDWRAANANSPNAEIKAAIATGRQRARALAQNNPYALKALNVIVNETVGTGIVANIKGRNKTQTKRLNDAWKQWALTTLCDFDRESNYYGLQSLLLRSIVESGEGLGLKKFSDKAPCIKLIESDLIYTANDYGNIWQGIELDEDGRKINFVLFKTHPGDRQATAETVTIPVDQIIHVYKKERAGQLRGITWFHSIIEKMKDFEDFQATTLIRQKISACFSAFITTNNNEGLIDSTTLKAKREASLAMQPAQVRYLAQGEDVKLSNPPGVEGYADFNRETLRAIASGFGISYEALTTDYSQSNYSSSRMGHIQMRKNIDAWRWNMLIPQFCEPTFKWFLEWANVVQGIDITGVTVNWVPPAYSLIDPTKEIDSLKNEVRNGFKSYGSAILELGEDPDNTIDDIATWNQRLDEKKIVLDIDPRKTTLQGMVQSSDPNAIEQNTQASQGDLNSGNSNQKDVADKPNQGSN